MNLSSKASIIRGDEPIVQDQLNREQYAAAFAQLAVTCETPMVIGLYGGWGVGKTTLMYLIKDKLPKEDCVSVWFDSWLHQHDEAPALALLQTLVQDLNLGEQGKKIILTIATAFSSSLMQRFSGISHGDVREIIRSFEEENFEIRETRSRLRHHFRQITARAQESGKKRLVFFVDDLDRCSVETTLAMLEALKLYLNLPGCVYFLGVDRSALERSVAHRYGDIGAFDVNYLDKIVQLPFAIPPIAPDSMDGFVSSLLSEPLFPCKEILIRGLGDNPRRVKRFINTLALNHQLALEAAMQDYDPALLAATLLIQYRNPKLYDKLVESPEIFRTLLKLDNPESKELIGGDLRLQGVLALLSDRSGIRISQYLYLAEIAGSGLIFNEFDVVLLDAGDKKIDVIKAIRVTTNLGLKEAKDLSDSTPCTIVTKVSRERAQEIVKLFEQAGATVDIKSSS